MKKRILCFLLVVFTLMSLSACGRTEIKKDLIFNYLESTALLPAGNVFATVKGGTEIRLFQLNGVTTEPYLLQENAVDVMEQEHHRIYRLLHADDQSFFYGTQAYSTAYGVGSGFRIYRYFLESRKTKLVYKDISLTNFDAFLGLNEVFGFFAPTVKDRDLATVGFCIDESNVLSSYQIAQMLNKRIKMQPVDIDIRDSELFFCLAAGKVFFTDSKEQLWHFDSKTSSLFKLPFDKVMVFFVTSKYLFVIPEIGSDISVCDFSGKPVSEIKTQGSEFAELYCLVTEGDTVYIKDQENQIWRINERLQASINGKIPPEAIWTVKDETIYYFFEKDNIDTKLKSRRLSL